MALEAKCKVGLEDLKVIWAGVPVIAASNSLDSIAAVKNRERERERERETRGLKFKKKDNWDRPN